MIPELLEIRRVIVKELPDACVDCMFMCYSDKVTNGSACSCLLNDEVIYDTEKTLGNCLLVADVE